nr:EAL domain-containing protein [Vibrio tapetis]
MKEWHVNGVMLKDIAVNLSALQLNDAKIVSQVKSLCEHYQLSPNLLTLEVTETSLLSSHTDVIGKIKELKEFGIKIALDDFGTGYSSLSYLNELPLTKLKIDRSFVAKVGENDNEMLLDAIFSIAHGLSLSVIAEGVETQNQFDYIVARQCEYSQGYLFSKPVPPTELELILRKEMSPC